MNDQIFKEIIEAEEEIYKGKIISVFRCKVKLFNDRIALREKVVHPDSAAVIVTNDKQEILLVCQFRQAAGEVIWEIPAGKLDPGETPLEAARREVMEETGCRIDSIKKLMEFYPSPGIMTEKMNLYIAKTKHIEEAKPDTDEVIDSRWFSCSEIERMVLDGEIKDAKSIIGILLFCDNILGELAAEHKDKE